MTRITLSPAKWAGSIIGLVILTAAAILFDIPFLRQILGFMFLAFLPGFLVLSIMRLNKLDLQEKIVLSVGLSISFVIFFGLLINILLYGLGYPKPLSSIPLLVSFSLAIICLTVVAYMRNRKGMVSIPKPGLSTREKAFLIVPAAFPLLSIVGLRLMNLTSNNTILMFLLGLIPAYVIFISFFNSKVTQRIFPFVICLVSISLVLFYALRSNHIIGSDIHELYYFYRVTLGNSYWRLIGPDLIESSLITSLFPAVYGSLLGMDPEFLFRLLYSLLFSVTPLAVYSISKRYIGDFYAFLAAFFFMSQYYFAWTSGAANTAIAILFFSLVIMVLFSNRIGKLARQLFIIIFLASIIVSHYSATYVFLFVLLLAWSGLLLISKLFPLGRTFTASSDNPVTREATTASGKRVAWLSRDSDAPEYTSASFQQRGVDSGISITIITIFFVMLFLWYGQFVLAPFDIAVSLLYKSITGVDAVSLLESRGPTVIAATGAGIHTIPQQIRFVISWLSVGLIAMGVLTTMIKHRNMVAVSDSAEVKPGFLESKLSVDFFMTALACSAILAISVILPYIQVTYSMERTYYQLVVVLAPFFVIGGILLAKLLKVKPNLILLVVLVPYFLSTSGLTYQLFNQHASLILNSKGSAHDAVIVYDQERYSANWIARYRAGEPVFAGPLLGVRVFVSQALVVHPSNVHSLIYEYKQGRAINGYIYLRNIDLVQNVVAEYPEIFVNKNKIYSAGTSEVYR